MLRGDRWLLYVMHQGLKFLFYIHMLHQSFPNSAGQPYCCVKFVSLRSGDEVNNITFSHPVADIKCNER
jgi:hypothetical protein